MTGLVMVGLCVMPSRLGASRRVQQWITGTMLTGLLVPIVVVFPSSGSASEAQLAWALPIVASMLGMGAVYFAVGVCRNTVKFRI